jgi:putative ABC transport system permease protein
MGIALKRGRDFAVTDAEGSTSVAIVNESFVNRHFGTENPIGKRISLRGPGGPWIEIVGVAADSKYTTLNERPIRLVYLPIAQNHVNGMTLVVRTNADPSTLAAAVGREVHALDKSLPVAGARTLNEWIGISIYAARAGALLLSGFGALALLLAAVGLYGVLAYAVSLRTREFGLRMALGARARTVLGQVMGEGGLLVGIGLVVGLIAAFSLTRLLSTFLFDVSPTDVRTFIGTPAILLVVAMIACLLPALRATRVDPIKALKEQ